MFEYHPTGILGLLALCVIVTGQTFYSTSTANNIVDVCHCDLTKGFGTAAAMPNAHQF
jgi:hypothetical protein